MPRGERGLTLLEVLAAVAILGILYTALATKATQGIHNEANTRRRLEASLLADQTLSDIELQIAEGATPPLGKTQSEQGDYRIEISVDPLALPAALTDRRGPPEPGVPSVLGSADGTDDLLRRIQVDVIWPDGVFEQKVGRVTYAYDVAGVQAVTGPPQDRSTGSTPSATPAPGSPAPGAAPGASALPQGLSLPNLPGEANE